jgi:hypothetical protein
MKAKHLILLALMALCSGPMGTSSTLRGNEKSSIEQSSQHLSIHPIETDGPTIPARNCSIRRDKQSEAFEISYLPGLEGLASNELEAWSTLAKLLLSIHVCL